MSHLVLTAVFGKPNRNHPGPRNARVLAQVFQGGSRLYLFHRVDDGRDAGCDSDEVLTSLRLRADDLSIADALRAGFALIESVPLTGRAAEIAERVRFAADGEGVEIGAPEGLALAAAVTDFDVAVVVTSLTAPEVSPEHFPGWRADCVHLGEVARPDLPPTRPSR